MLRKLSKQGGRFIEMYKIMVVVSCNSWSWVYYNGCAWAT